MEKLDTRTRKDLLDRAGIVRELKDMVEDGMFVKDTKFEVKELLEYPSNKKIKVDSLRKKGLV